MSDIDLPGVDEKVTRIQSIEEKTSSNGNDYVLVTDMSGDSYFAWSEGWREHLTDRKDFYQREKVRISYEEVDPPYYCVLRYVYPVDWDDSKPGEKSFEVSSKMSDDETLRASDVPREERIVNQAGMKFAAEMAKIKDDLVRQRLREEGSDSDYSEEDYDEALEEEINKWMSKFKRASVRGEIE